MVQLRVFDAFPKVDRSYVYHNSSVDPTMIFYCLCALFFLYVHTTELMGNVHKQTFDVDPAIQEQFQINMGITVKSPCSALSIFLQDISDDRLMVNELVQSIPMETETGEELCQIHGVFDANRVRGRLTIMPHFSGYHSAKNLVDFNSSHLIETLYFGELPGLINPLQMTQHIFQEPTESMYYLTLIPTSYKPFGIEVETYQYAVSQRHKPIREKARGIPAIHFHYDFDPIRVTITDNRISFIAWLCRAANILGGILFTFKAIKRVVDKKIGRHDRERYGSGLLDPSVKN